MATRKPAAKAPARTAPVAKAAKVAAGPMGKAAKETPAAKPAKDAKAEKPKKPKLLRDSFTIPKTEYAVIDLLKQRAARLGRPAKKSEVLRAGVKALEAMNDAAFLACVSGVPAIKTGRPAKTASKTA
jgi:hypothetical protein